MEATSFVRSLGYANDKTASLLGENEKVLKSVYDAPQIGGLTDVDLYALREACGTLQHQTATANHATLELRKLQVSQRNKTIKAFAQRARASEDWEDVEAACERWCAGKTPRWRADVEEKSRVAQAPAISGCPSAIRSATSAGPGPRMCARAWAEQRSRHARGIGPGFGAPIGGSIRMQSGQSTRDFMSLDLIQ